MSKYKAALIGCGNRSRMHVNSYIHLKDASLIACCDLIEERRKSHEQEFGIKSYSDAYEMIDVEQPDIVHIVTQPAERAGLMHLVARLNVPVVIVEKPVTAGIADYRSLIKLEENSKTKFAVSHQFRWQKDLVKCQSALNSGRLGNILFMETSCGMNISNQGTHILNYVLSLNNDSPVKMVFGNSSYMSNSDPTHPAPDHTEGYLIFENGVRALWNAGPTAPMIGDPSTTYKHCRMAAYASKGRVLYEEFGKWEIVSDEGTEQGHVGDRQSWIDTNLVAQSKLTQACLDWMRDDSRVPGTNLKQSLHEFKVVLALYASSLEHRPIEIESFDPSLDLLEQLSIDLQETG